MLLDHSNLTIDQNKILGEIVALKKSIENEIAEFENTTWKDYEKLSFRLHYLYTRVSELYKKANEMEIPEENQTLFYNEIYTGLINPNRFSYVAYWN